MPIFAVHYTFTDETMSGRDKEHAAHLEWVSGLVSDGVVLSAGGYADGSGAMGLVSQPTLAAAEKLLTQDPYVLAGMVDKVWVLEWTPTLGAFTAG